MAKINIPNISSPYASQNALNERFKMIEDVLNDKVLWRDNPVGEVNTLKNDIDLGNNDLLNVGLVSASSITVQGQGLEESLTEAIARCTTKADEAEASANVAEEASSKAYAPQSIIKAALGLRPEGWTAADCDAPVQSMTAESTVVQIASGLQVAYADEGRVQLSDVLDSAHAVDLSSAVNGMLYIYADLSEDGKFAGFGHTATEPMVGTERSGSGDLYNPVTVTHYNSSDVPIRRVYLGWVGKVYSAIPMVHCYSLGDSVTLPVNTGAPVDLNTVYSLPHPFVGSYKDFIVSEFAEIKLDNTWYSAKSSGYEGQSGVGVNRQQFGFAVVSKVDALLHGLPGATGSAYSGSNAVTAWCRIHVKRGY